MTTESTERWFQPSESGPRYFTDKNGRVVWQEPERQTDYSWECLKEEGDPLEVCMAKLGIACQRIESGGKIRKFLRRYYNPLPEKMREEVDHIADVVVKNFACAFRDAPTEQRRPMFVRALKIYMLLDRLWPYGGWNLRYELKALENILQTIEILDDIHLSRVQK